MGAIERQRSAECHRLVGEEKSGQTRRDVEVPEGAVARSAFRTIVEVTGIVMCRGIYARDYSSVKPASGAVHFNPPAGPSWLNGGMTASS